MLHDKLKVIDMGASASTIGELRTDGHKVRSEVTHYSRLIILVVGIIGALYLGRAFLVPVVSAFIASLMLGKLLMIGGRLRIPRALSATFVVISLIVLANLSIMLIGQPIMDWIERRAEIKTILVDRLSFISQYFSALHDLQNSLSSIVGGEGASISLAPSITEYLSPILSFTTPAIGQLLIFLGSLFFFLLGREEIRKTIVLFSKSRENRLSILRIFSEVEDNLVRYFAVVTCINIGMGVLTTLIAFAVGLPSPLTYGIFAFLLNYIPYLGPAFVVVLLLLAGMASPMTMLHALIAPGLYVLLGTIEGHFVTPAVIGRQLTLSAMSVFFALVFWTWLWGPVGALLASPFLIIMVTIFDEVAPGNQIDLPG